MRYYFLSQFFYNDYPAANFPEIERKSNRPYATICITINNHIFALPLRSHINHPYAYLTDKTKRCGVDFSKAVYISDNKYLDVTNKPYLRQNEFNFLKGKEYIIKNKFISYIKKYVAAQNSLDKNKMKPFKFSTLHYFDKLINYENDILIPITNAELSIKGNEKQTV